MTCSGKLVSRSDAPALSIVVPCCNEQPSLRELHGRVTAVCRRLALAPYEFLLVDDGSTDGTWPLIRELAACDPCVVGIALSRNHGHQLALTAGLSVASGARIFVLDADLQDPPELLEDMLAAMDRGADVVYGVRRHRAGETRFKRWTAAGFYRLLNRLSDVPIPVDAGDFRLMSRRVVDVLLRMPERHRFIRGMVSWVGFRQVPLPYDRAPRVAGESKYPFVKMLRFAFDGITGFSAKPLRLAIWLGFGMTALSIGLIVYSLVSWLCLGAVRGWTSLLASVSLIGGMQFIVLGLIGDYLARIYEQSKNRPLFVIRDIVSAGRGDGRGAGDETRRDAAEGSR
ncbi:MAG: glycosyltransferase family 2 protein [Kiritimatiellae bacterium]|nr:glycosyltransferase family 2 protein [Kiritimatiellia bacterium]